MNDIKAQFFSIGRLDNCRLDFIRHSNFWEGPTATVVPTANAHMWGVIWRMHTNNISALNEQEGVERKIYYPAYVNVLTPYLGSFNCLIYIQKVNPLPIGYNDEIPIERWPSWTYKEVIILGALEHQLPEYYIQMLEKIKNNGGKGCFKMYCLLLRYAKEKPCRCIIQKKIEKPRQLDLRKLRQQKENI
ncbi:unnamed protein product [Euphydryas editha]|nr:unnamed protein product [Euphydryas editha]